MSLLALRLEAIAEADLAALIAQKIPENTVLEYKQDVVGAGDKDRYEFLADVSSFANTAGGEILFGIAESSGIPIALPGVSATNVDQEILRLEQIIRTGTRPTIAGISTRAILLKSGKSAIAMRIPKSWNGPHQIGQPGSFRFFGRASNGKYQLDVDALRLAFRYGPELTDRIKAFRADRLAKIISNTGSAKLPAGSKIVLHLVPTRTFAAEAAVDLSPVKTDTSALISMLESGGRTRVNLDGYIASALADKGAVSSFVQLFRDGKLEAVEYVPPWNVRGNNFLPGQHFDERVQSIMHGAIKLYRALKIDAPIVAMLSLLNMQGRLMGSGRQWGYQHDVPFDAPEILCPDVLIEDLGTTAESIAFPIVNLAWNAAGYEQSVFYDSSGKWIGK
jgi:hypothetical protein